MKYKTIVIGSGRLGANIAQHLSISGQSVDIIDLSEESFRKLSDDFTGSQIVADGTDLNVLEEVGIKKCNRLVITTSDDNTNIYLAHLARFFYDTENVIIRLYDISKASLISDPKIKAIYPFTLSLDEFIKIEEGDN